MSANPWSEQEFLAAIVASSDDAIIGIDLQGKILTWNAAAEKMYGYTRVEAVGRNITMIRPRDRASESDYIMKCIQEGKTIQHHLSVRVCKDGSVIEVSVSLSPVRDEGGVIVGAATIAREMSRESATESEPSLPL